MNSFPFATTVKLCGIVATAMLSMSCAAFNHKTAEQSRISVSEKNEGYAILYDLVSDEKHISKLLIIKKERPEFKTLIKRIAASAKETATGLEAFAKKDRRLNLKITHLPAVEQKTRDSITSQMGKQILTSSGDSFESKLLMTQVEGLNYAAHLAKVLSEMETDLARKQFLQNASEKFVGLHDEVYQMLLKAH
ncbi:MAG: hypothetical protein ABIP76_12150 [Verrucomicrobiota bacterium]